MISARIQPPAPATARGVSSRNGSQESTAPAFEDALRDQEPSPADPEKEAAATIADANVISGSPPAAAPVPLDALIAQLLPSPQAGPSVGARPAPDNPSDQGGAEVSGAQRDRLAEQDLQAAMKNHAHARKGDREDSSMPPTRSVAVRSVTTENHFAVTMDPVRQIVTQAARALEEPAMTSGPEQTGQPVKTVSVQLEPESLGAVTLRMRLSGNQLSVRVEVSEPATLELIQRDRDRLQKSMASDHVSIERLDIRAAIGAEPVQGGDNARAPGQDPSERGDQPGRNGASPGGDEPRGGGHRSHRDLSRKGGHDKEAARGGDSRGVYL